MTKKRVHFIGICGSAMANLAVKLQELGYAVTGSDEGIYPPMSTFLQENNVAIQQEFSEKNLVPAPELVIIGNAVCRGNPEAEYVLDNKLSYISLPQALREIFLVGKQNIVVTGTHGKTTSSSLLAWILEHNNRNPNFLIGGIPLNFGSGFRLSDGPLFVLEGDEYDSAFFDKRSKFIHYLPETVIINNIEFDHCDIFRNLEDVLISFRNLINIIPQSGLLVANGDDANVRSLLDKSRARVETFGFRSDVKWRIVSLENFKDGVRFELLREGKAFGSFFLPMVGDHNTLNAVGAAIVLDYLGLSPEEIQSGLDGFKSIKRRLEVRGRVNDITVYDDFAHHPTAVRETLEGLHLRYPESRLWAVFEPRTNTTRRNIFQKEFSIAFDRAHGVAIGAINRVHLLAREEQLDREQIRAELSTKNKEVYYDDDVKEIVAWLVPQLESGDHVVVMSNGSFDNIHELLLKALKEKWTGV